MIQRGRKSAAKLAVVTPISGQRPRAPRELTKAEAEIWKATVATKPADWFRPDSWPLLTSYCRHAVMVDRLTQDINRLPTMSDDADNGVKMLGLLDKLLAMRERETRSMSALARAMRLTHQSRLKAETAATAHNRANGTSGARKPWQE